MKLPEFFAELDRHPEHVPIETLVDLMGRLDVTDDDYGHAVAFDPDHYKRNVLKVGPGYAALVLCWQPGQASPIHDHHGSACGVRVLQGAVTETKYRRGADGMLIEAETATYPLGNVCGSYDADIHVIRNDAPSENLVTLHVYTPPMREYHVYTLESADVETCRDVETLLAQQAMASA